MRLGPRSLSVYLLVWSFVSHAQRKAVTQQSTADHAVVLVQAAEPD